MTTKPKGHVTIEHFERKPYDLPPETKLKERAAAMAIEDEAVHDALDQIGHVHYYGWTPGGQGSRCGAQTGLFTSSAQETTCPACLKLLDEQLNKALR